MYKLLLLLFLTLASCADEPQLMLPSTNALEDAHTLDNVWVLPHKNAPPKTAPKDTRPYIAPLPYYCDPNVFPPNIVLTASACRIFLDDNLRKGYVVDR